MDSMLRAMTGETPVLLTEFFLRRGRRPGGLIILEILSKSP